MPTKPVGLREDPPDLSKYSGNRYVSVKARRLEPGEPPRKRGRIFYATSPKVCRHVHSICSECSSSWSIDYVVEYQRTLGGRMLLEQINNL